MPERAAWVEIDLKNIRHNVREIKTRVSGGAKLCAVVKANAYGHGAVEVAKAALAEGADYLAVAILAEALELRAAGITAPVLILGFTPVDQAETVVENDITQAVFTPAMARALSAAAVRRGRDAKVHLKLDTGMGRIGVNADNAAAFAKAVAALPGIVVEGLFSHFSTADSVDKSYCLEQIERFKRASALIEQAGIAVPLKHIANSAAILELPDTHFSMVRAGIILYGLWPSDEVRRGADLRPAMRLKARIAYLKEVASGSSVSYGRLFRAARRSVIATLPLGYADGYTRLLTGKAQVWLRGRMAPVAGKICMDQCMIDVTDVPGASEGDEVILFGNDALPADELARWLGTINYEVVCAPRARLPRVYVGC